MRDVKLSPNGERLTRISNFLSKNSNFIGDGVKFANSSTAIIVRGFPNDFFALTVPTRDKMARLRIG